MPQFVLARHERGTRCHTCRLQRQIRSLGNGQLGTQPEILARLALRGADPGDAPLALGALLLRASRTDHAGLFADPSTFEAVLALCYDLTAREASEMREACERVEAVAPDCASFAEILQRAVGLSDRQRFALSLHQVLLSAGPPQDPQREALSKLFLGAHSATNPAPLRAG